MLVTYNSLPLGSEEKLAAELELIRLMEVLVREEDRLEDAPYKLFHFSSLSAQNTVSSLEHGFFSSTLTPIFVYYLIYTVGLIVGNLSDIVHYLVKTLFSLVN